MFFLEEDEKHNDLQYSGIFAIYIHSQMTLFVNRWYSYLF